MRIGVGGFGGLAFLCGAGVTPVGACGRLAGWGGWIVSGGVAFGLRPGGEAALRAGVTGVAGNCCGLVRGGGWLWSCGWGASGGASGSSAGVCGAAVSVSIAIVVSPSASAGLPGRGAVGPGGVDGRAGGSLYGCG